MLDLPPEGTFSSSRIAEMLAATLGCEKSTEVVDEAIGRLRYRTDALNLAQALALLADLARTPGMVGIAARFARSRIEVPRASPPSSAVMETTGPLSVRGSREPRSVREPPSTPKPETTVTADEIALLLSGAMGTEKAQEVVLAATRRLGIRPERIDKEQAMTLLDQLAVEPGVVGLCARFTKARLILRFAA
jgi:hypothetical protein